MHLFISMMYSLLVITGLQVSVQAGERRPERSYYNHYKSKLTVSNGGRWGSWGHKEMCPTGSYAAGFSLKVDHTSGFLHHSTALNGVRLHCLNVFQGLSHSHHNSISVHSDVGSYGQWTDIKWCPTGFLSSFQLRVDSPHGAGYDTAANNIKFKCSGGTVLQGDSTSFGDWGVWSQTCGGKGICGIKTRVDELHGTWVYDTALNDACMYCCT